MSTFLFAMLVVPIWLGVALGVIAGVLLLSFTAVGVLNAGLGHAIAAIAKAIRARRHPEPLPPPRDEVLAPDDQEDPLLGRT